MSWPGPREWLFSAKAFAAAMLAFWINCALNLPRPTWSIFIVYLLIQPVSGAIRSEAMYRMLGTLAGAGLTLLLTSLLADLPGALVLAVGAATLAGLFIAMIDQMPRGHIFLMTGLTVAVVGLPDTLAPLATYATVITRTEEVLLGIACITVVDTVVFPHAAGVVLNARVAQWLAAARNSILVALRGPAEGLGGPAESPPRSTAIAELGRLASDAAQLEALASHVAYDSVPVRPRPRIVRLLHARMLLLIRTLYSCHDWMSVLLPIRPEDADIGAATEAVRRWAAAMPAADESVAKAATMTALRAGEQLSAATAVGDPARATLLSGIGLMLQNLVAGYADCVALQHAIAQGTDPPLALRQAARDEPLTIPYRDPLQAVLVLLPVALAFLLVLGYWTVTSWQQGATAAMMTLIAGAQASAAPEPAERIMRLMLVLVVSAGIATLYLFAVIPAVHDFPMLVAALGLFLLPVGAFIPIAGVNPLLLAVWTLVLLSLQTEYDADFVSVVDGALGSIAGVAAALVLARIMLAPGLAWRTRHLLRTGWDDLAAIAGGRRSPRPAAYAMRALERLTALAPQLDAPGGRAALTTEALLAELRIGLNLLRLRETEPDLPPDARQAAVALREAISRHFDTLRRGRVPPLTELRDRAATAEMATAQAVAASAPPAVAARTAWLMQAGIQRSLFGTSAWTTPSRASHAG
jgi:uncharacterized membrane protein YccC